MKRLLILVLSAALVASAIAVGMRLTKTDKNVVTSPAGLSEAGEADTGGPSAPGDYMTLKWTSGKDVTPAQVRRAESQAAAIPQGPKAPWQLVGPSNVGARDITKSKGLGLGLPYARRVIEQHGGEILVESSPGEGTLVVVRLPAPTEDR